MHQWMGNLFYRGAAPSELEAMSYERLKYWNHWHTAMETAEKKSASDLKKAMNA